MRFRFSPDLPAFLVLLSLVFASQVSKAAAPDNTPAQDRTVAARQHTLERLAVWQERLDLQTWKISVLFTRADQLQRGSLGDVEWDRDAKSAVIRVLDPTEYRLSYADALNDMEFSVLHGLIHLELSSLPRTKRSRKREDFAISQLADALLRLDRARP